MWDGYLDLAGTEIINSVRAAAYARHAGLAVECFDCDQLYLALADEPYEAPHLDTAPWFDTSRAESGQFLGVMGMSVAGVSASTYTRTPVPLVGDGSAVGASRRAHREMAFTVSLIARGERGLSYGIEWLAAALQGAACGTTGQCDGAEACMFSACPTESPGALDCAGNSGTVPVDPEDDLSALGVAELRHFYDVALLEGPVLGEVRHLSGGFLWADATFTLVAGKPWIFHEPVQTFTDWVPLGTQPIVGPLDPDAVYAQCVDPVPCLDDPTCPTPMMPPRPPIPPDPCYTGGTALFRRALIEIDPVSPPDWLEMVPVIEVSTGSSEMRRLIIRFWTNNANQPCSTLDNPCDACLDLSLNYLPMGALLTIDGRIQRASVGCPQGEQGFVQSTPYIFGRGGRTFTWPVFACPTGLCVEVLSQATATAANAQVRVRMVPRSDAA